ncbi:hypothetical protein VD0002_g1328 [Verticillium dahliae]|uniref:Ketoreductase domain-containing protein n=1 Tax=Verticillium dahliae TaxID=27337 RepID=A0AA44WRL3_VERDA|nr:hypothetical protein BJF96_g434 [Verticillium dahliae]PNH51427.1 hypothetical protein VD0003_g5832 [Verticillium dahliae]PNH68852.1 hypothetical protein VD0002_g1328 [Verticillium dahliae]
MDRSMPHNDSWFDPLSIDLILKVLKTTFFHPFISWVIPLCFRAQMMDWSALPMLVSIAWASLITLVWTLSAINTRVAYGPPRHVDLADEVIVITGGASGLGLLLAEVYGMRGATVAVLDPRPMENGAARGVTHYPCDVSDKAQLAAAAAQIERDLGPPTVLVNNAAVVTGRPFADQSLDALDRSLAVNLLAPIYTLKTFLPSLLRAPDGATIVTVSSVLGRLGAAGLADYAAAKAGLSALHASLTAELRRSHPNLRTVLVEPGQLSTPLFHGVRTPNAFLAPVVEPVDVCKEIVAAIDAGRSAHVALPLYARWVDWYAVLPAGMQVLVRRLAGLDRAMDSFIGRREEGPLKTE